MNHDYIIRAATTAHLGGILTLQQANLISRIDPQTATDQGFVTVEHDMDILKQMNDRLAHAIAVHDDKVIGFALAMDVSFGTSIPLLTPMFDMIDRILAESGEEQKDYMVMGQICIDASFRGLGIFQQLYQDLAHRFRTEFNSIITEIATRNLRSRRAHEKVGFQLLERFRDETDEWDIVQWKW